MVIEYNDRDYYFNDEICSIYEKIIGETFTVKDILMCLKEYTKHDPEIAMRSLASIDVSYIVTNCIKDRIAHVYGEDFLNLYV